MNNHIKRRVLRVNGMSDYIKRDAAMKIICSNCTDQCALVEKANNPCAAIKELVYLPSEDVAPVRHGHWDVREPMPMHDIKGNLSWGNWYVCTGCGFATTAIEWHITQYKYCPSCGARMDAKE